MMRVTEALVFLSLASALHAGLWVAAPLATGTTSRGGQGQPQVTLSAAAPAHAAMVREWSRAPRTGDTPDRPAPAPVEDAPADMRPDPAGPELAPAPHLPALLPAAMPQADRTPPARVAPPRSRAPAAPAAPLAPTRTDAPPARASSGPPGMEVPQMTAPQREAAPRAETDAPAPPEPRRKAATPRPAQPSSPPATGGGQQATKTPGGQTGTAQSHSRDGANANALIAGWGAKIQRKVHRRVLTPRGVAGSGTVRVALTVGRDGALRGARVTQSSGIAAFDQAALNAVHRAGRFPPAPGGLTKAHYNFTLSLNFRG